MLRCASECEGNGGASATLSTMEGAMSPSNHSGLYCSISTPSLHSPGYRETIPSGPILSHQRRFPAVPKLRKYPSSSDDYFKFEIQCLFDTQLHRPLYVAQTPDKQPVIIKFAQRYSIELHEFCANSGHAPQILAFERLPGGWYAVAMEYIEPGFSIVRSPLLHAHQDRWAEELKCLVYNMHSKGLVHGDLRDANILCKGDSVMLVDFDWGGKDGEVFYPTGNLNDELREGRASNNNLRITKEDDRRVLGRTLAKISIYV
jgi:hypothetical protein